MGTESPASQHLTDDPTVDFLVLFVFLMNLWSKMFLALETFLLFQKPHSFGGFLFVCFTLYHLQCHWFN